MTLISASYDVIYSVLSAISIVATKVLTVSILLILTYAIAHNITEIFTCLKNLSLYFISHFFPMDLKKLPFGRWCIITGATQGIGKAYAEAFAKRGMKHWDARS